MVFDFDSALKSGFQKGEIVDFLRQQAKSDINWQEIDELKAQAKANNPNLNENAFVFDYLQNGNFNFNSAPASREDTLALIKEQEKQYQNPNLLERGLESISEAASNLTFGLTPTYESQATQKNQKITDEIYKTAVLNGIDAKDLSQKTNYEIAEQKGGFFDNFRINNTNTSNELIKQERLKQSALNKNFADLNPQEKQAFKSDLNVGARAWDYFFSEDEEQFENWKETKRTENLIADYQSAIDDINRLNTYHQNTSLYNTFFGKDSKLKEQYLKDVNNIAAKVGFDGAEFKENGELYLLKDEEAYKVNEEFFKNLPTTLDAIKNEIALGMGGAVAGARAGASVGRIGGVVGAIGGGAVGAVAGAVGDVLSNNAKLDRENNTKEIISHALEAGTLSLAGDAIALGLAKGGKPLLKKAKNVISKASDNIILAGFVRNLPTQNLRAAQKILNNSYTKEEKEALFAFGEEFGGRLKSGETSNTQKLIDFTQDSNLPLKSTALKMLNAINKPTLRQRQLELIELIRADESGSSLAFLTEVANTSPKASKVLGDILNATTYNLQKQLKEIGMDNIEIRQIYENLKNKTKADYNDVMENVLGKIYDSNYKTTLDNKNYLNFRKELENSGILESDAMAFLKDIEANIYNPNGVEFKQLNNALKRLNAYTKSANPNLNEHLKSAVRGFLKEDIKKGIDEIFAQNTQGYADAKRLFESALSDYATMKEIFKVKGIKSLMDSTKTKEAAEESFVKYLQGQGEANKSNYEILTQNLPKEQKENLELGVINQIFNKSLSNGDNGLNVFNSVAFNKEIEGLKDKFTTKGAKDALELIGGFHKLFLNDGEIAYALRPAKTGSKGMSSTIATSIKGATEQKTTSAIMDLLMRNLPELGIPFTPIKFRAFNERIQGAALRYHLLSALNHSVNVEDFKSILQRRNTPNNFNLPTREFLNEFLKQVDEIKTETLKDAENLRTREAESFEKQKMEAQFSTANLSKEQIPQELQEQWIKEFNLQSIDDTFVPSFKPEVKEALAKAGVTEDIKLTRGSLLKLIERDRQEFLPYIKETLENSDAIIKDKENVIIFAKDIGHTSYFTSVAKDNKGEWVITTNSYKTINQLKNRVNADGELLYLSKEAPDILAEAFTAKTFPSELESNSTTNLSKEQIPNNLQDTIFKDTKGKEHTLTKETQEQWLKTFGLENLEQSYIPKHSEEIKQALGGKEIRLQKGSLLKLVSQGREEFIPQVKAVLDEPDLIIKEPSEEILLAKHLKNEDYFVNVSFDNGEYLVSISNGIKETRNLQNKLNAGAKIIYQSPNANSISQTLLQTSQYSANKIDNVDSTTNLSKSEVSSATLSPFARAEAEKQARLEIQAKEEAQRELQREARREEIKENQRILQEQKDKESGQSSLNREVDLGDNIKVREIKAPTTSVTLGNNEVLELKYVVVKQEDLKTNFNGNALQPRTQSNPAMIERIATQFKPNLVIGRGGFEDLPILAPDGQVIAGNHRVEGMKQFNQASRKRYEDAIKESFGVELKSDELLLRMPKDELENQKLVSLAFVSNANTNLTYGDKVMSSLGKYAKELEMMPRYFGSESVDELSTKVAKSLENNELLPNEEEANLALLGHLAKNSNGENIASVLTRIYQNNNRENFTKIKDMFVKNAGAFHNLINDTGENGLKNLELRPYLLDSINATSQSLRGTRADNFKKLVEKIENVLKTTDENGSNVILQQDSEYYKNLIGEILGASLAKFARQENPANALYEVLKNAKADLIEELSPTLFKEGKGIEKVDIYDFLELLISKGEASEVTSRVIDLLPALKEKEKAFNEYIKNNNLDQRVKEIENGKYSNGNNNNFDTSSSNNDSQKMGTNRDIGRRNNGDESTEMGGLRAGEEKQEGDSEATKREVGTRDTATKTRTTNLQETKELSLSKAQAKKQEILNRALTKKQEQLAKLEKQYQEAIAKENSRPIPPPNQSNNSRRAADRALSTRIKNLLSKIEDKKNEIILLDPNASKKEKYIAQRGQTYYNSMLRSYENFTKNKQVFLDKDIFKTDLLGFGINSNPQALREFRNFIEHNFNITALKEFGTNYAEFYRDGQGAIAKILSEAKDYEARKQAGKLTEAELEQGAYKGQVAGAFYKEELGDIDLVWGEITDATNHKGYGLSHILDKRTAEFMQEGLSEREAKAKAEELIGKIPNIVENGKVVELGNGKIRIVTDDYTIGMKNEWHNKPTNPYILTTFENNKKSDKNLHSTAFTKGETLPLNSKADSTTTLAQYQGGLNNTLDTQRKLQVSGFEVKGKSYDPQIELLNLSKAKEAEIAKQIPKDIYELEREEGILVAKLDENKLMDFLQNAKNPQESKQVLAQNIANTIIRVQGGGVPEREMYKVFQQIEFLEQHSKQAHSLQNPNIEYALKEYKDLSKQELEELISKGEREALQSKKVNNHNFQTQEITYYKDTTKYTGQIGNYLDESLGMGGNDFYLAKVTKTQNAIDPKHWERDLRSLCEKALKMPRDKAMALLETITSKNPQIFSPTSELRKKAEAIIREYGEKYEKSPNIYQSNAHIGSGLVSGTLAGVERDENGNIIGFDPSKFALGFLGGAVGSKAVSQGFKVIKDNPQLKESLKQELANTLAKGWEATTAKYPILKALEPMKIMQSQKGRIAQAGHIIDKTFLEQSIKVLRDNVESMPKELSKEEFLTKGLERVINKESFLEHLQKAKDSKQRLAFLNLVEPTMAKANIELDILTDSGELRKGYLKAFEYGENRDLFYLLVTQDKDKLLISGYPISKEKEIKRILKKAKSITFKEGVAFEEITNRPELNKSSTLKTDSTIDSKLLSKVQSKFKYDEKKASDLLEWHKDSSPITKDKDGLPKVFYHGSKAGNIKEFKSEFDESGLGFWFVDDIEYAKRVDDNLYEVFLNVKNPIDFRGGDNPNYPYKLQEEMDKLGLSLERYTYQTEKTKEFLQSKGYDALILDGSNKEHPFIAIFDSNQIKHIDNKGSYTDSSGNITSTKPKDTQAEHRYFNEASPNIYQSNAHIGSGLVSGTLAGVERDENGNIVGFDPSKFALGFLGGAVGSKAVSQGFKVIKDNPQLKESLKQELANTLAKGWEATTAKYPILKALEPMKIMQSQKGRIAQAGHLINKMESRFLNDKENVIMPSKNGKDMQDIRTKLLDIEQKINYSYLKNIASKIPSPLTQDEFLAQFPNKNRVHIKTPISEVEIQPKLIWEHLQKQSNKKEDRNSISGAIIQTLQEPLFITKDKKEAFYFYRPFLDSKGVLNLVSVQIPKSNRLQYKTSYIASKQRMMKMLKEYDLVYERF